MTEVDGLLARLYDDAREGLRRRRRRRLGFGSEVCLRASDGSLLRLQDDTGHLVGGRREADRAARFVLVRPDDPHAVRPSGTVRAGDAVGFRSVATGRFVGVDFDHDRVLTCWGGRMREWETFSLGAGEGGSAVRRPVGFGSEVSLRVRAAWHGDEDWFLQYRQQTSKLCRANVQHVRAWETFVLLRPADL